MSASHDLIRRDSPGHVHIILILEASKVPFPPFLETYISPILEDLFKKQMQPASAKVYAGPLLIWI